jgi:sulfite exporter TauE/SafE
MCGPILAACGGSRREARGWPHAVAYNAGRIASYCVAGAFAGAFGGGVLALRGGGGAPALLAIAAGTSMIVLAAHLAGVRAVSRILEAAGGVLWRVLQPHAARLLPAHDLPGAFGLGLVWGWLPCGMVYGVLLTAVAGGSAAEGALVMAAFGLGTLPNVLGITLAVRNAPRLLHRKPVRYAGATVVGALGLIAVGLAFGGAPHSPLDGLCRLLPAWTLSGG